MPLREELQTGLWTFGAQQILPLEAAPVRVSDLHTPLRLEGRHATVQARAAGRCGGRPEETGDYELSGKLALTLRRAAGD